MKVFNFFSFYSTQMEQEDLCSGDNDIIKNAFYKNTKPVNINQANIKSMYYLIKNHMVLKIHLNNLLAIDIVVMLLQRYYV